MEDQETATFKNKGGGKVLEGQTVRFQEVAGFNLTFNVEVPLVDTVVKFNLITATSTVLVDFGVELENITNEKIPEKKVVAFVVGSSSCVMHSETIHAYMSKIRGRWSCIL